MIVSVVNIKGGVGKTTTVINLCFKLIEDGYRVLLVDADKQASATDFKNIRFQNKDLKNFPSVQNISKSIGDDIKEFRDFDVVLADVGAKNDDVLRSVLVNSDILIRKNLIDHKGFC